MDKSAGGIEFVHGYTYSGHPLAVAAGIATQNVIREEGVYEQAAELAPAFEDAIHSLRGEPYITDIRNIGLAGGITIEPRDGAAGARAHDVFLRTLDEGALVRANGDQVVFAPILTSTAADIEPVVKAVRSALRSVG